MENFDLAVVGGGASGLAAALAAAERARKDRITLRVAVLEKNPRVGKKLLTTGSGRCNLTNLRAVPEVYRGDAEASAGVLLRFPPQKILSLFREQGLLCREETEGRVYPASMQAQSVLNVLRRALAADGVRELCDFPVDLIERVPGGFAVHSMQSAVYAKSVIVAVGGKACPQSGSSGDGYALLRPFGHSVTPLYPSLVQVRTEAKRVKPLKGVRCPASASFLSGGKVIASSRGEVQFTENALSGICIFELSRFAAEASAPGAEISLDLAPEFCADELSSWLLSQAHRFPGRSSAEILEGFLNKSLCAEVCRYAFSGTPSGVLTDDGAHRLARAVKSLRFPTQGVLSWQNAQVTAGGVPLSEVDGNLQSRFCPGLYLCGEFLNVDGGCGGFNLQWAWASGITAGQRAGTTCIADAATV